MKRIIHALVFTSVLSGLMFTPACAVFVHDKEPAKSSDTTTKMEHSETSKQTEVRDTGTGTVHKEVEMEHREVQVK